MKKLFLSVILSIGLFGCQFGCQVEQVISSGLANGISTTLVCSNTPAIQASVQKILNFTKFCAVADCLDERKRGNIANIVCPLAAATAVSFLGNQIPADWGCQPMVVAQTLTQVVTDACVKLPF